MAQIKVLIVDDHAMVRRGLRTFLGLDETVTVVGEAANGREAVEQAEQLQPDVILMDLVMPELDGIAAIRRIREKRLNVQILVLTSFAEDDKLYPAIEAGALGYLLKDIDPEDLVRAIQAAHRGEAQLHPDITRKLMDQSIARPRPSDTSAESTPVFSNPASLTDREIEVLRLIAGGLNNREIAERLVISEKTVKTHVSNLLSKLAVSDRTQAAIYALKEGLTPAD